MNEFDKPVDFLQLVEAMEDREDQLAWYRTPKSQMKRRMSNSLYQKKLEATLNFIEGVREGDIAQGAILEAMSTPDFSVLTTNILSWKVASYYNFYAPIQRNWARMGKVQDFRTARASVLDGLDQPYTPVAERGEYPEGNVSERDYGYKVYKFGKGFSLSFEATINDFLNLFDDLPQRLAMGARNTESIRNTQLYMGTSGPVNQITDALAQTRLIFDAANKNFTHAILGIQSLQDAITAMNKQLSESGLPIIATPKYLEVPPDLEFVARSILSPGQLFATSVGRTDASAPAATTAVNTNVLAAKNIEIVVNPFLPYVGTGSIGSGPNSGKTYGQTSWFLWADPQFGTAIEMGQLAGHETPELWQRKANAVIVGGGEVPPGEGSFEDDTMRWRCRMFWGGVMTNPKFVYGSDGTV